MQFLLESSGAKTANAQAGPRAPPIAELNLKGAGLDSNEKTDLCEASAAKDLLQTAGTLKYWSSSPPSC